MPTESPPSSNASAGTLSRRARWRMYGQAFWPAPIAMEARERWRAALGAGVGVALAAFISHGLFAGQAAGIWLLAPLGASAVLVFAVPLSPLAQPWAVLGGNGVSALVGVLCARWVDNPVLAASLAVPLAILLMLYLRCLHPPGGAMALSAVLGHWADAGVPWAPLLANAALLIAAGVLYNTLTGRAYPQPHRPATPATEAQSRFTKADMDAALAHYHQLLDVSRDDLETLLQQAELAAYRRKLGALRCEDVMSASPVSVQFGTPLREAWSLLQMHRVKALPVVDRARRMVGIITVADFMRHAGLADADGLGQRLRAFIRASGTLSSDKPEVVGQIMTRTVRVASAHRPLMELVPLFSEDGHHHIPIIDGESRLVGIITQSDLMRALYRAVRVEA